MLSIEPLRSIKLKVPFRNYPVVQSEADIEKNPKNRRKRTTPFRSNSLYEMKLTMEKILWWKSMYRHREKKNRLKTSFRKKMNSYKIQAKDYIEGRAMGNLSELKCLKLYKRNKQHFIRNCQLLLFKRIES